MFRGRKWIKDAWNEGKEVADFDWFQTKPTGLVGVARNSVGTGRLRMIRAVQAVSLLSAMYQQKNNQKKKKSLTCTLDIVNGRVHDFSSLSDN